MDKNKFGNLKKPKAVMGFGINDCPIWLFRAFAEDAKDRFNDCYWAKLHELILKADAYDNFIHQGGIQQPTCSSEMNCNSNHFDLNRVPDEGEKVDDKDEGKVETFGETIKNGRTKTSN